MKNLLCTDVRSASFAPAGKTGFRLANALNISRPSHPAQKRRAFSLIEILGVVAIMSCLMAMIVPAMQSISRAGNLNRAGNLVVDLGNQARQNSVSKGAMTALIMVNDSAHADWNYRLFMLAECLPGGQTWKAVTPWFPLPDGVVVDPSQSSFSSPSAATPIGTLIRNGQNIADSQYVCQIYLPDGRLMVNGGTAPNLRMVEGELNNGALAYARKGGANYYDVTFNLFTGIPKVERP